MKIDNILKFLLIILILFFISLYSMTLGGYYEYKLNQKNILTEEAIKKFEEDVKLGKEIIASNYIKEEKNYNNKASVLAIKLSNIIEIAYKKTMKLIFSQIDKTLNS